MKNEIFYISIRYSVLIGTICATEKLEFDRFPNLHDPSTDENIHCLILRLFS